MKKTKILLMLLCLFLAVCVAFTSCGEDEPTVDEPAVNEPTDEPTNSEPTDEPADDPTEDTPTVDTSKEDEPTVDEPTVDEPTVDAPTDAPTEDSPAAPDTPTEDKPQHEHIPGDAVVEKMLLPTCVVPGSYDSVIYCTECNTELSRESETTYKLAHIPKEAVRENLAPRKCEDGTYDAVIYCEVCDAELSREQRILEAVHNLERKKCLDCGFVKASERLVYVPNSKNMTCTVSKGTCTDTEIGIPARYGIFDVIAVEGFENSPEITSVVIADGVKQINGYAFSNCPSLAHVDIPDSVSMIYDGAFFDTALSSVDISGVNYLGTNVFGECRNLTDVTFGNNITSLSDGTFAYCESLSEITLPDSLSAIFGAVFRGCSSLVSLKLPDNVHLITSELIAGCENLQTLYFGASVKPLNVLGYDSMYLDDCPSLERIEISPDNKNFKSVDGVVYSKDGSKLYYYPIDKGDSFFEIPEGVETVGEFAFKGVYSLVSVTLPSTLALIEDDAFLDCYKLVEVINRSGMKLFQNMTNDGCVVYYAKEIHSESETKIKNFNEHLVQVIDGVNYYLGYVGADSEICISDGLDDGEYEIHPYAFYKNESLTRLTVGEKISKIGENAFWGCTALTSVTISASVQSIGKYAFSECTNLSDVYLENVDSWYVDGIGYLERLDVTSNAAKHLKKTYCDKEWRCVA